MGIELTLVPWNSYYRERENVVQSCNGLVPKLLNWYEKNKRALPWRENTDPYSVWISEIMLQQTRVDTVIEYYRRFMERFPTIQALARGSLDEVLKLWEGLGYYTRARNLHRAAREILGKRKGMFPEDYEEVLALPGIGKYTAGAIMSIAFNKAYPAVDGNVLRVVSRLFLLEKDVANQGVKQEIEAMLNAFFPEGRASDFTQSLMELGALVCLPSSPKCHLCPVNKDCKAFENNRQNDLPLRQKKPRQKKVNRYIALIQRDDQILMNKRSAQGLLGGLWEFPGVEEKNKDDFRRGFEKEYGLEIALSNHWMNARHIFTHLIWEMKVYRCKCLSDESLKKASMQWIPIGELNLIPIPTAFQKIKEKITVLL